MRFACLVLNLLIYLGSPLELTAETVMKTEYILTSESNLTQTYIKDINPFWDHQVQKRTLNSRDGIALFVVSVVVPDSKGTIVFSSGRTEGAIKYKELFYNLVQNGYSVFAMDHRGQGQSQRLVKNRHKGHVQDYQDYVDDLHQFYEEIVRPESDQQPMLLCHSMGCAIGAKYNLRYPDHFSHVVYSSPMFAIKAPIPVWLANTIVKVDLSINQIFSDQPWYFLGQGDYQVEAFEGNDVTHSKERFQLTNHDLDSVSAQLGGITSQWLHASIKVMQEIEDNASQLRQATLILQAGGDTVVDNKKQNKICRHIPNCQLIRIHQAKHELLLESDEYRNQAITHILTFFQTEQ